MIYGQVAIKEVLSNKMCGTRNRRTYWKKTGRSEILIMHCTKYAEVNLKDSPVESTLLFEQSKNRL